MALRNLRSSEGKASVLGSLVRAAHAKCSQTDTHHESFLILQSPSGMVELRAPEPCFRSGQARLGNIPEPGLSSSSIIGRNYVTVRQVGTKAQVEAKLYYDLPNLANTRSI